uniref:NADH deshydrogenase subunit 6 n=1 Tax=Sinoxylon sp. SIN01 TaxID=1205585 RepID=A0A0S2MNK4_9COLE|nr:NADH deshydrogenase subunit 6 [Sinoxylon sp. SIN01]
MIKLIMMLSFASTLMLWTRHPLTMAVLLMVNTCILALLTGLMNLTYWYSFMLFMIMIGGMLVLIIYMTTVASNEMLESLMKSSPLILGMVIICLVSPDLLEMNSSTINFDVATPGMKYNFSLSKYISTEHLPITFMLINYLFITLIGIVKITSLKQGSLRQKL